MSACFLANLAFGYDWSVYASNGEEARRIPNAQVKTYEKCRGMLKEAVKK